MIKWFLFGKGKETKNVIDTNSPRKYFKKMMENNNISNYIYLTDYFLENDPNSLYLHIDGHSNEKGNLFAADALYNIIAGLVIKN